MKEPLRDLMVDIETLGNRPTSVITQIGACYFHRETGEITEKFCVNIDVGSALMAGLTVDEDTIQWWRRQPRLSWLDTPGDIIENVLGDFSLFAGDAKYVWSHATFDMPILSNAYAILNMKQPFHYRCARDIRTLVDLSKVKIKSDEPKTHDALEDCIRQVKYCVECFNKLKEKS